MAEKQAEAGRCGVIARVLARVAVPIGVVLAAGVPAPGSAQTDRAYATQPFTPKDFKLPEGGGCAGAVARWKAVQDNDYAGGNIGLGVYRQIQGEIDRADAACRTGREAESIALVRVSKRRHGYPE